MSTKVKVAPKKRKLSESDYKDDELPNKTIKSKIVSSASEKPTVKRTKTAKTAKCVVPKKVASSKTTKKIESDIDKKPKTTRKIITEVKEEIDGSTTSKVKMEEKYNNWNIAELLSDNANVDYFIAKNIVNLFDEENTIPFICRYRKDKIGDISPERLRDIKMAYNSILNLKQKAETITKTLMKSNLLTEEINNNLMSAKTLDELEHLYAPYKPASKASLVERAKKLGLETPAKNILYGISPEINLLKLIDVNNDDLKTKMKVESGIGHILSHIFSKDTLVLEELRRLYSAKYNHIEIKVKQKKSSKDSDETLTEQDKKSKKYIDPRKFEIYFDFTQYIENIKPHQILAINRGENLNILSVKIIIPDQFKNSLKLFLYNNYMTYGIKYKLRTDMFNATFEETYSKKFHPLVTRHIRNELTKTAENSSIEVFATNLKQLLLMTPVKGQKILGIDPGFTNGCKIALISECTDVLATCVIYPHTNKTKWLEYGIQIADLLAKYKCNLIALGNGTASRETETWLNKLFDEQILSRDVSYCIVSEQGVSIYSCSEIARREFPKLDVNLISAVSIAKRLNDPLAELVKVEPKHLGVGMYQHDVNEKSLSETLDEVIMECVSFVGVDLNTASVSLLSHISGLTEKKAEHIINYRQENGPLKSRDELHKVKYIGEKTFTQCAGFLRIEPKTAGYENYNKLDSTWVHPESYDLAKRIILSCKLSVNDIGSPDFILKIKSISNETNIEKLSTNCKEPVEKIKCILDALQRKLLQDYRSDFDKKPMFRQGITKITDLKIGEIVSGAIINVTHFGSFVDIGVGTNGLIHTSELGSTKQLTIGDRIHAKVLSIDIAKKRIGLTLKNV